MLAVRVLVPRVRLSMAVVAMVALWGTAHVQNVCQAQPETFDPEQFEVHSISFQGNEEISSGELATTIVTRETPGFMGKFLYSLSQNLGRPNEYFNLSKLDDDLIRLRTHYWDRGFRSVRIDTSLRFDTEKQRVSILFILDEGQRSIIDSLAYIGLGGLAPDIAAEIANGALIKPGDAYNKDMLENEGTRIIRILNNSGFPRARFLRDSSSALYYTSTNNFVVALAFQTGRVHHHGDIGIVQELAAERTDIGDDIIHSQLDFRPGDTYSLARIISSERNLNRLGIFDLAAIDIKIPEAADTSAVVTSIVRVRPKDKHELAPELIVSDENNAFNLGSGLGYTNRNFLGGARTFSTRLRFRTQTIGEFPDYFNPNSGAVANTDLTFELLQPYIFTNKIKGSWTFSLILEKQKPYRQEIMRTKFGLSDQFGEHTIGFLDWTLERVRLRKNANYPDSSSDPAIQAQINALREQERRVQFNSILSFTVQWDRTNDIFSPSRGNIHTLSLAEGGLLPLLLKRAQPDLPFTQFYRISVHSRWYVDVSRKRTNIVALKLRGGFEDKYGETRSNPLRAIPQDYRFYAGGGGSIRGWGSRALSATGDPSFGGNVMLEGSVEMRTNILSSLRDGLLDKIWTVLFLDIGNVWGTAEELQPGDIAIAAGFGLRYDTFFGPFRADFGFRVYDPVAIEGRRWITERKFFGETITGGALHFGIGHAF